MSGERRFRHPLGLGPMSQRTRSVRQVDYRERWPNEYEVGTLLSACEQTRLLQRTLSASDREGPTGTRANYGTVFVCSKPT